MIALPICFVHVQNIVARELRLYFQALATFCIVGPFSTPCAQAFLTLKFDDKEEDPAEIVQSQREFWGELSCVEEREIDREKERKRERGERGREAVPLLAVQMPNPFAYHPELL